MELNSSYSMNEMVDWDIRVEVQKNGLATNSAFPLYVNNIGKYFISGYCAMSDYIATVSSDDG